MRRTVAVRASRQTPWRRGKNEPTACGMCSIKTSHGRVAHELCPGTIVSQDPPGPRGRAGKTGTIWTCACHQAGHPATGNPQVN